jgi:hypothetical protein
VSGGPPPRFLRRLCKQRSFARSQSNNAPSRELLTVLPKDEARQGETGHNVRYVLGIGFVAAIAAMALIYSFYFMA